MKSGNIPESLTFFLRPESSVRWRWEDVDDNDIETKVYPCYISDAKNKKTLETGKSWGSQRVYNHEKREYEPERDPEQFTVSNKPFKNLKIVTLEIRDKGGRAYKVTASIGGKDNLYFDLREDVLLDIMFECGIKKGGICEGPFVFARIGSQMKPIRIGSLLHNKMIAATEHDKKETCKLVIGGWYVNKKGEPHVYLGEYWSRDMEFEEKPRYSSSYSYYNAPPYTPDGFVREGDQVYKGGRLKKPEKYHVFHNYFALKYPEDRKDLGWFFHNSSNKDYGDKKGDPTAHTFCIVKNHSFKVCEKVIPVPPNYVQTVKDFQEKEKGNSKIDDPKFWNLSDQSDYIDSYFTKFAAKE